MAQPVFPGRTPAGAAPTVIHRELTAETYFTLGETSQPQNLIGGSLYVSPQPDEVHEDAVLAIAVALRDYGQARGGQAFVGRDCWLGEATVIQPDVAFVTAERRHVAGRFLRAAPSIVVEVVSEDTRWFDIQEKFGAYAASEASEAWFVDLAAETVTVFCRDGSEWNAERPVSFGEPIPSRVVDVGAAGLPAKAG